MKRVMFVTNSLTGGGAERSMNLVCNELFRRGWPIALVPINSGPPDQVTPLCAVFPLERQWKSGPLNTLQAMVQFNQIVKSWKPDVVVLNCDLPELFGASLCQSQKFIVLEHSSTPWAYRKFMGILIRKILSLRRTKWAAVSPHLSIWPSDKKPLFVLPNPITPIHESKLFEPGSEIKRLVFIGRLSPEKQPDLALEISNAVGLEVVIIGEGAMRQALEKMVKENSVNAKIEGQVTNPWSLVRSGDLLIVTSTFEGDGLVVIEGMQKGIPMLLSDIPDLRRFALPDRFYCQNLNEFCNRINDFHVRPDELIAPHEISSAILSERSIENVVLAWEALL